MIDRQSGSHPSHPDFPKFVPLVEAVHDALVATDEGCHHPKFRPFQCAAAASSLWDAGVRPPAAAEHPSAILTGGIIPAHAPGAYKHLSCCGGEIALVPA